MHELRDKENEGEDSKSQGSVGGHFAANISIEQAHSQRAAILARAEDEHGGLTKRGSGEPPVVGHRTNRRCEKVV